MSRSEGSDPGTPPPKTAAPESLRLPSNILRTSPPPPIAAYLGSPVAEETQSPAPSSSGEGPVPTESNDWPAAGVVDTPSALSTPPLPAGLGQPPLPPYPIYVPAHPHVYPHLQPGSYNSPPPGLPFNPYEFSAVHNNPHAPRLCPTHAAWVAQLPQMYPPPQLPEGALAPAPAPPVQPGDIVYTSDAATRLSDRVRRKCFNCETPEASTWRKSTLSPGKVLCNKCGLYERTHQCPRPSNSELHRLGGSRLRGPLAGAAVARVPGAGKGRKKAQAKAEGHVVGQPQYMVPYPMYPSPGPTQAPAGYQDISQTHTHMYSPPPSASPDAFDLAGSPYAPPAFPPPPLSPPSASGSGSHLHSPLVATPPPIDPELLGGNLKTQTKDPLSTGSAGSGGKKTVVRPWDD